jgi:beta-xylosidase
VAGARSGLGVDILSFGRMQEHGVDGAPPRSRGRALLVVGLGLAALALTGCLPPKPAPKPAPAPAAAIRPPTTTKPPPPPPPPVPSLPSAPGGASASGVTISGTLEDFPDPFVLRIDDTTTCGGTAPCYYAYATEAGFLGLLNVPVARSTDLTTWAWTPAKDAMPGLASWVQWGGNWSPEVLPRPLNGNANQKYVMYYTAKSKASSPYGGLPCVGIATSASPAGPFVDSSPAPVLCATGSGGTIDPSPYVASDGSVYLSYVDDLGIHAQKLTSNGLGLAGGTQLLLSLNGAYAWEYPRVEAPSMMNTPATGILLFYSAEVYTNPGYSVGVARCDSPLGPCHRIYSTATLSSRGTMYGPGGQTPFQRTPGGSWMMAFHAWDGTVGYPAGKRSLHFLPLTFNGANPRIG